MSLFFIRLIASIQKRIVTPSIHSRLQSGLKAEMPIVRYLSMLTMWVRGRTATAMSWIGPGRSVRGKKVPLKRNIGVMKRKIGKLKKSIVGVRAVKHIATAESKRPARKEKGSNRMERGEEMIVIPITTCIKRITTYMIPA